MNIDELLHYPQPALLSSSQLIGIHGILTSVLEDLPFVIAGGAARDAYFGRPVKDIDVWLPEGSFDNYRVADLLDMAGAQWETVMGPEAAQYFEGSDVLEVYEALVPGVPVPVQLIVTKLSAEELTPGNLMDRMDIDLCRCFLCPTFGPVATLDAVIDYAGRTLTVTRCRDEKDKARTEQRIERLSKKYSGFRPVWQEGANV